MPDLANTNMKGKQEHVIMSKMGSKISSSPFEIWNSSKLVNSIQTICLSVSRRMVSMDCEDDDDVCDNVSFIRIY